MINLMTKLLLKKTFKPEDVNLNRKAWTRCWKFFHFREQRTEAGVGKGIQVKKKAYCNICGKGLAYIGTTSRGHLRIVEKHSKEWNDAENLQIEGIPLPTP